MRGRALAAAVTAAVLVTTPVPAVAGPRAAAAPAGTPVPCPHTVPPAAARPPRPVPPPAVPEAQRVGGDALATPGLIVPPGTPAPPALTATSWVVADLDSGAVLGACGPHEYGTPASTQKLLLAATMMPKLDPKQLATVTRPDLDIEPGSSAVGLVQGGRYRVETLWLGLLLNSGNEAANLLARLGAGSVPAGVAAMNAKARELGALQTHAVTPSGLDGRGQFTSAYDLALIGRACFAIPDFRRYALTRSTTIPAQPALKQTGFQIQNENKLIYNYPGALGGKTGFTELARHTYVGAAQRAGRRLVVTLLGAERYPLAGWKQGAALLDWGFSLPKDASVGRLVKPGELTAEEAAPAASPPPAASEPDPADTPGTAAAYRAAEDWTRRWWPVAAGAGVVLFVLVTVLLIRSRGDRGRRRRGPGRRRAA
ncbi:D-alanyl-D-alanine carboxypeptidase family protein [Micromonospora mirobrigensis]|uniref:D-alanyl-D-alanine carboxypeptidase (Penicillin-binding protein 5/6) n=1 Tax=Micromonospora mirobrigensis TaxID=262898 RepID=A0A1C4WF79_9ACTN|nr:serine hydrolase [Micromonospora mirobrigensis]SCE94897.1 D-alanyl-D-alanine carboxypeptidase (penicillin-binding protein 5/6) [Micromonospora mirobrigensis]